MRARVLTIAAVIGVAITASPAGALDAQSPAPAPPAFAHVVTLGDSYSSGSGIHRHANQYPDHGPESHAFDPATKLGASACHREPERTPGPRLAASVGARSTMVACAGARIEHLGNQLNAARIDGTGAGTLIVLTIGGNDVRSVRGESWNDVVERCIKTFGCDTDDNAVANLIELESQLTAAYLSIGLRHREATVRVLGYPRLMQPGRWLCVGVPGIGRGEANWIDRQVDLVNGAIERAVARAGRMIQADLAYVPVLHEFDNRGACRGLSGDRYVRTTVLGQTYSRRMGSSGGVTHHYRNDLVNFSTASFHPSQDGYDAYGRALLASL